MGVLIPPINRWAIFGRPCGTGPEATRQILAALPGTDALRYYSKVFVRIQASAFGNFLRLYDEGTWLPIHLLRSYGKWLSLTWVRKVLNIFVVLDHTCSRDGHNLFKVEVIFALFTQGSSCLATLGFEAESLWDSPRPISLSSVSPSLVSYPSSISSKLVD
jgi:hypothetical protein